LTPGRTIRLLGGTTVGGMQAQEPEATSQVLQARRAGLLSASGLATYFFCIWATSPWLGFPIREVTPIFVALIALNVVLAAVAPAWGTRPYVGAVYGTTHALVMTLVFHELGGLGVAFLVFVQLFPIFHAAMLGSTGEVFLTANVTGASFALLAVAEATGALPMRGPLVWSVTPGQAVAAAGISWAGFNFFALYASSYGEGLRRSAHSLQEEVAARTMALQAANAELERRAEALEAAQDELRTLLYAVTHDIKSPVNSILLIADLLREQPQVEREPAVRSELDRIIRLAGGTEDMIRDLFDFFQLMTTRDAPDWFELNLLAEEAIETIRPQLAARGVVVEVEALPRVWGERRKIGRVLTNLLRNAMQHAAAGRGRVRVAGAREAHNVRFSVSDNGAGIAPRYHAGIFELFGRVPPEDGTDDERPGSGVGLAVVRRIVEAHHGRVWVESDVGRGAVFHVVLPVPQSATREDATPELAA
jgi:signal transduction histidine kinase